MSFKMAIAGKGRGKGRGQPTLAAFGDDASWFDIAALNYVALGAILGMLLLEGD